jgi:hypothetical protein
VFVVFSVYFFQQKFIIFIFSKVGNSESSELFLVIVNSKCRGATEERVVHEDVWGVVVGVRVPQTSSAHTNAFATLLSEYNFDDDLQLREFSCYFIQIFLTSWNYWCAKWHWHNIDAQSFSNLEVGTWGCEKIWEGVLYFCVLLHFYDPIFKFFWGGTWGAPSSPLCVSMGIGSILGFKLY